jgi:WD40 repeat protein
MTKTARSASFLCLALLIIACVLSMRTGCNDRGPRRQDTLAVQVVSTATVFRGHTHPVQQVRFCANGTMFVSAGGSDGTIRIWDIGAGREVRRIDVPGGTVNAFDLPASGTAVVSGSNEGVVQVWDLAQGTELRRLEFARDRPSFVQSLACSPQGSTVAVGGRGRTIWLCSVETGKEIQQLSGPWPVITSVRFSSDARMLACAAGAEIAVWAFQEGERQPLALKGHAGPISSLAFVPPDCRSIVSAGLDGSVRLWPLGSADGVRILAQTRNWIHAVAVSADGRLLAFAGGIPLGKSRSADENLTSNDISVVDPSSGTLLYRLVGHSSAVGALDFAPNARQVISGDAGGVIRLWTLGFRNGDAPE